MRDGISETVLVIEEAVGVEHGWLRELVERSVEVVGPRLHHHVDDATGGVAVRGIGFKRLHSHFLHGILLWAVGGAIVPGGVWRTIDQNFARLRRSAADAPGRRGAVVEGMHEARLTGRDDADG